MGLRKHDDEETERALDGTNGGEEQETEQPAAKDTPKIRKLIKEKFKRLEEIDADRKAANADKAAVFDELAAAGVSKKGAQAAYKRFLLRNEDDRESHDFSFALCCKAVGVGIQEDLLADQK